MSSSLPPSERLKIHGHEIAFRRAGSGPVLLLIHGMAGSSATWRHVMPILAREFTIVAPDMLGHGESAKPRADYSLGAHAACVRDLMIALGYERATLVGQSWGGGVAMQLAYQFPERCERLVLVSSGGLGVEVNAILRAISIPGATYALPIGCPPLLRDAGEKLGEWLTRFGKHPGGAEGVEIWRSYVSLADPDTRRAFLLTLRSVVDHLGQRVSARDRLYLTSDMPTLIVWGDKDPIIPVQHARDAHEAIPGSRLEIFPGVGHYPHCGDPARFARVLAAFVHDTPPAAVSSSHWRDYMMPKSA
jgi:pimeloyl-ACP methyl ester carboxylesterase